MAVLGRPLFSRIDGFNLGEFLRVRGDQGVRDVVDGLPDAAFTSQTDDSLTKTLVDELTIVPLQLALGSVPADVEEITGDAQDLIGAAAALVRARRTIPFTGDSMLWRLRPTPCEMRPPYGSVLDQTLVLGAEGPQQEVALAMEQAIQSIARHLEWQAAQIASFNGSLPANVLAQVQLRRSELKKRVSP